MRYLALALFLMALTASDSFADDLSISVTQAAGPSISSASMYAIELTCTAGHSLPDSSPGIIGAIFLSDKRTLTHFVLISPTSYNAAASISAAVSGSTMASLIFSVDQGGGTTVDNRGGGCKQSELLTNQNLMYLIPVAGYSDTVTAGTIGKVFDDVVSVVTALAPVFTGTALIPNASKTMSAVGSAIAPMTDLAQVFKPSDISTQQNGYELKEGVTTIQTKYSTVTVGVRRLATIVDDTNPVYRSQLEKTAKGAGVTIVTTSDATLRQSCDSIEASLALAGIFSPRDRVFGIVYAAFSNITKDQLFTCLGTKRAWIAVQLNDDHLFDDLPNGARFSHPYYDQHRPPPPPAKGQPTFQSVRGFVGLFTQVLGTYLQTPPPPSQPLVSALLKYVDKGATIADPASALGQGSLPTGCPAIVDYLLSKGYNHAGYFAQVTNANALAEYGAQVGLLLINVPAGQKEVSPDNALAVYPIFDNGIITQFFVTKDPDQITALAGSGTSVSGLKLDLPVGQPQPPPVAQAQPGATPVVPAGGSH